MRATVSGILLALIGGTIAYQITNSYSARMSNPDGYQQVAVDDAIDRTVSAALVRPRHTLVVVVDGLRQDAARGLATTARLASVGQCRTTDVGLPSISRPVYAVLSTGLEQDRTGIRNNDEDRPLGAQSIWQVARTHGLRVTARSELAWFHELFPDGFDDYVVTDHPVRGPLADLTLLHPVYVDDSGHAHGGTSPEYAAAVARVDRELAALIDQLDLSEDTILLTADHGHVARGGHGGTAPEVRQVLSCFAGRSVLHQKEGRPVHMRDLAPILAVLLGLPFPRHMRAGEDGLEVIWEIARFDAFPPSYRADRTAALQRFRAANAAAIGSWSSTYRTARAAQAARLAAIAALLGAGLAWAGCRRGWRGAVVLYVHLGLLVAATLGLHQLVRGGLDLSAINHRGDYITMTGALCVAAILVLLGIRLVIERSLRQVIDDQVAIVWVCLLVVVGHPLVFGSPLGFPLPRPFFMFLPFLSGLFALTNATVLALLVLLPRSKREADSVVPAKAKRGQSAEDERGGE